jgi:hypothetical protein
MRQRSAAACAVGWLLLLWAVETRADATPAQKRACDVLKPADVGAVVGRTPEAPAVSTADGCAYLDQASGLSLTLVLHGATADDAFATLRKRRPAARDEAGLGVPAFSETSPSGFAIYALKAGQLLSLTLDGKAVPAETADKLRAVTKALLERF